MQIDIFNDILLYVIGGLDILMPGATDGGHGP